MNQDYNFKIVKLFMQHSSLLDPIIITADLSETQTVVIWTELSLDETYRTRANNTCKFRKNEK